MPKQKNKTVQIRNSAAEFLTFAYQSKGDGVEVRVQDGTVWLSQKLMAVLFDCTTENIIMHLKNIFKERELDEISVAEDFSVTAVKTGALIENDANIENGIIIEEGEIYEYRHYYY